MAPEGKLKRQGTKRRLGARCLQGHRSTARLLGETETWALRLGLQLDRSHAESLRLGRSGNCWSPCNGATPPVAKAR